MRALFLSLLFFPLGHFLFGILMQLCRNVYIFSNGPDIQFFTLLGAKLFGSHLYYGIVQICAVHFSTYKMIQ